ncbi:SH3 domain-containing protein [Ochrobactrum quorumnocens]|uniref:SH3 domain-containing protein n=1 Tax=Ochrobactrum quorumnocens TaxID=271865 RepID=UPI00142DEEBB|nr:SH3 domain-containing protein [[Ochrobactrum] quorumnocens]
MQKLFAAEEQGVALGFLQATSPRNSDEPARVADQHPFVGKWLYASSRVNMRAGPSTSTKVITAISRGATVKILNYRSGWFSVSYANHVGWVSEKYISQQRPLTETRPVRALKMIVPTAPAHSAPVSRSGQPVRSPYVGTCDCPYDLMRNGHQCGGRRAYRKPGGGNPICYD